MTSGYELLANAIVKQAARDYEQALCEDHYGSSPKTRSSIKELERYFNGNLIMIHTQLDGPTLMRMIRDNVKAHNYDLKAIKKARSLSNGEDDDNVF